MKEVTENEERFKGERIGQLYIVNNFSLNKLENFFSARKQSKDDTFTHLHELATGKKHTQPPAASSQGASAEQAREKPVPEEKTAVSVYYYEIPLLSSSFS